MGDIKDLNELLQMRLVINAAQVRKHFVVWPCW